MVNIKSIATNKIELLTLLIEKWDEAHNSFHNGDPVTLLKNFDERKENIRHRACRLPEVSKGLVSDILSYKNGLSKEVTRGPASYFKLSHEAFNRHYELQKAGRQRKIPA